MTHLIHIFKTNNGIIDHCIIGLETIKEIAINKLLKNSQSIMDADNWHYACVERMIDGINMKSDTYDRSWYEYDRNTKKLIECHQPEIFNNKRNLLII